MFDVHIGTPAAQLDLTLRVLRGFTHVTFAVSDGDSWIDWGEPRQPHETAVHAIARTDTLGQAIDVAMSLADPDEMYRDMLTAYTPTDPLDYANRDRGVTAVVSLSSEWSEQFLRTYDTGARTVANNNVGWA